MILTLKNGKYTVLSYRVSKSGTIFPLYIDGIPMKCLSILTLIILGLAKSGELLQPYSVQLHQKQSDDFYTDGVIGA